MRTTNTEEKRCERVRIWVPDPKDPQKFGRRTGGVIAAIVVRNLERPEDPWRFFVGASSCRASDPFNFELGQKIAVGRAECAALSVFQGTSQRLALNAWEAKPVPPDEMPTELVLRVALAVFREHLCRDLDASNDVGLSGTFSKLRRDLTYTDGIKISKCLWVDWANGRPLAEPQW